MISKNWRCRISPPSHCSSEIDRLPTRLYILFLAVFFPFIDLVKFFDGTRNVGHITITTAITTTTTTTNRLHRILLMPTATSGSYAFGPPPRTTLTYTDELASRSKTISPNHAYGTVHMLRHMLYGSKKYKLYSLITRYFGVRCVVAIYSKKKNILLNSFCFQTNRSMQELLPVEPFLIVTDNISCLLGDHVRKGYNTTRYM